MNKGDFNIDIRYILAKKIFFKGSWVVGAGVVNTVNAIAILH